MNEMQTTDPPTNPTLSYPHCVDHTDEHLDCAVRVAEALNVILSANNFRLNWVALRMAAAVRGPVCRYDMHMASEHLRLFCEETQGKGETT